MESLSVTLIGLLVLIAVTNAALETHLCVDMSHETPCKGWPAGLYPVCFGCGLGFFAECQGDEATVLNCPTVEDTIGYPSILMFDNVTKTCVEKTDSCLEKKSCVDMADIEPCEGFPDVPKVCFEPARRDENFGVSNATYNTASTSVRRGKEKNKGRTREEESLRERKKRG
ncbi:hypothetical protein PoB_003840200 [Plakobranchus ocellatus]|uniref:Chitin-binding type-2 domain-containing protein n=1 Tax=Plakobranchus ocellatus TaxID=259542 RepID=A0AAV4AYA2_9GAST|nr:hypothetical protein PoB_003840200 [Plakobranchus ocellatus]